MRSGSGTSRNVRRSRLLGVFALVALVVVGVLIAQSGDSDPDPLESASGESPSADDSSDSSGSDNSDDPAEPVDLGGVYTVSELITSTISTGDGSNPTQEGPMGLHDAPLYLPEGWSWTLGPVRNSQWGQLGTGQSQFVEWRCAVIPESGHNPDVPFRVNVRNGAYWQYVNDAWNEAFAVELTEGHRGSYLGAAGQLNQDPFAVSLGEIPWRLEADGSYSAPWDPNALMMHFWAGQRQPAAEGQTAELITSELRLMQPDGQTVDLSDVRVMFQCGADYYASTGAQGTKVPGPGIGKYQWATPDWQPSLWVTLPAGQAADSTADFQNWLEANRPPIIDP